MALAVEVTGKTPAGATIMLSDAILRKQFLDTMHHRASRRTSDGGRLSEQIAQRTSKAAQRQRKAQS